MNPTGSVDVLTHAESVELIISPVPFTINPDKDAESPSSYISLFHLNGTSEFASSPDIKPVFTSAVDAVASR